MDSNGAGKSPLGLKPDTIWKKFNVHKVPPGKIVLTALGHT